MLYVKISHKIRKYKMEKILTYFSAIKVATLLYYIYKKLNKKKIKI